MKIVKEKLLHGRNLWSSALEHFLEKLGYFIFELLYINDKFIIKYPYSHSYHMLHVIMMMNDSNRKFMMTVFVWYDSTATAGSRAQGKAPSWLISSPWSWLKQQELISWAGLVQWVTHVLDTLIAVLDLSETTTCSCWRTHPTVRTTSET